LSYLHITNAALPVCRREPPWPWRWL